MRIILVFINLDQIPGRVPGRAVEARVRAAAPTCEGAAPQEPFFIGQVFMPSSR